MKCLVVKSPAFQYIENSFGQWLDILGYAKITVYMMPLNIRELFHYLEQNGITEIAQIEPVHLAHYYNYLKTRKNARRGGGLSNSYLNKQLQAMYKFTEYLRQTGRTTLFVPDIEWEPDDTETIEYLTQDEIKALYNATYGYNEGTPRLELLNSRDRAILTIYYGCGLRRSEGYYLDLHDIDFDRQIIHVRHGKAYKERFVPFSMALMKYLQEYIYDARPQLVANNEEQALFISQKGIRMASFSMGVRLRVLQERSDNVTLQDKNVRLHVLRHSIATHLLQNGMSLENIGRFLGHSSLESTQVYTHLAEELIAKERQENER
jgi:integrase/recombinase XerD